MTESSISEELVERALQADWRRRAFPPVLEARFEKETWTSRVKHLILMNCIGVAFFILFLVTDHQLVADQFRTALILRLGLGPLFLALAILVLRRTTSPAAREMLPMLMTMTACGVIVWLFLATQSPYKPNYLEGTALVLLYGNVVVQSRFPYALAGTAICVAGIMLAIYFAHPVPLPIKSSQANIVLTVSVLTVITNYRMERQERQRYLFTLRETLRNEALAQANSTLKSLSELDPLTGALNRRALDAVLDKVLAQCRAEGRPVGVIMTDIDHFKTINDHWGHQTGDRCLKNFAALLMTSCRAQDDVVARYGGEEFLLLLPGQDLAACQVIAERLRRAIEAMEPLPALGRVERRRMTASFGVASVMPDAATTPASLVGAADEAVYAAKAAGRNQVSPVLSDLVLERV
jgi:diguanylate cyclase (GGDEF)-like protein